MAEKKDSIDLTPAFYGVVNGDTCFCFKTEQARSIAKDIISARYYDTLSVQIDTLQSACDSAVATAKKEIAALKQIQQSYKKADETRTKQLEEEKQKTADQENLIKFLKFQRVLYPVLTAVGFITFLILLK